MFLVTVFIGYMSTKPKKKCPFSIKTDMPGAREDGPQFLEKKNAGCTSVQQVIGSFLLGRTRNFSQSPASLTKAALRLFLIL